MAGFLFVGDGDKGSGRPGSNSGAKGRIGAEWASPGAVARDDQANRTCGSAIP